MPLQIRRGTEAERLAMSVPLAPGEPLFVTDPGAPRLYIGNGNTIGGVLVSGYGNEDAVDAVGIALSNGTHQNITFTYGLAQDVANRIDASVDLSNYQGVISADSIKGSVFADNSTLLIDAIQGKINLDGTVQGDIIPNANEAYDIGSPAAKFKDLYLSGTSLYLGLAQITASGSAVNLPQGSTVDGVPISTISVGSSYQLNIVGSDSTILVNSDTNTFQGTLVGDVSGSVFADDSTLLVDGITRDINASIVSADIYRGEQGFDTLTALRFTDGVQERITFTSQTDGLLADQGLVLFRNYRGTDIGNPVNTVANDYLGGFSIDGYHNSDYVNASSLFVKWDADANFTFAQPTSTVLISTGNNTNGFPNFLTFNGKGVLNAPVIKATSYPTISLPGSPEAGWIVFDSTSNEFKGWNGASWVVLG